MTAEEGREKDGGDFRLRVGINWAVKRERQREEELRYNEEVGGRADGIEVTVELSFTSFSRCLASLMSC